MNRRRVGTQVRALMAAVALMAAACESTTPARESAGNADEPAPATTPTESSGEQPQPTATATATATTVPDPTATPEPVATVATGSWPGVSESFLADAEPPPADGGELVDCADVAEIEPPEDTQTRSIRRIGDDVSSVVAAYAADRPDEYGGMWVDRFSGAIIVAFTSEPSPHLEAILSMAPTADEPPLGERDDITVVVVQVENTLAELLVTQRHHWDLVSYEEGRRDVFVIPTKNRLQLALRDPSDAVLASLPDQFATRVICVSIDRTPERPAAPLDLIPDLSVDDPLVTCLGSPPFRLSALENPQPIDQVDHPGVDALTVHIAEGSRPRLRERDWIVLALADDEVVFAEFRPRRFEHTTFVRQGERWAVDGWGSGTGACKPTVVLPDGFNQVRPRLDPDALPDPEDTSIAMLVAEVACASGRDMGDDLLEPQIVETDSAVLVAFAAVRGDGDDCPGNPAAAVTIQLEAPLGDRELLDGLHLPPRPITDRPS